MPVDDRRALVGAAQISENWLADPISWFSSYPVEVRLECERIFGEMSPRRRVAVYVPDQDCHQVLIPAFEFAERLRAEITTATGGLTWYRHGNGEFADFLSPQFREHSLVIATYLPGLVLDALRLRLIWLFIAFRVEARQLAVQVEVTPFGFQIPTRLLLPTAGPALSGNGEGLLKTG